MAMTGSTLFSHIVPVIFGFLGIIMIISGIMDDKKPNLIIGIVLFVFGCISPFLVLSVLL
ncbi:MAG: hypothetical protein Q4P18_07590 [Methanobrevibacter sp.]|uniref:hypothetical protein n=1 Tax=Methanobrevibacter sp. TaxID=66852 RepID=UPI0026DF9DBC|nr:hypothetical protein [Methanobrevibacter sp.]MDO5849381.1 hypothetical protein [Methanobrevibacter sp.]